MPPEKPKDSEVEKWARNKNRSNEILGCGLLIVIVFIVVLAIMKALFL